MTSTNHTGYQVEALDQRMGWRQASRVVDTEAEAIAVMWAWPIKGVELRVMEALHPAPLTPAQWLGELGKRVKRFYRINQGQK